MNTKSELANSLKKILDQMTQEEFDSEWSKVTSLNLESRLLGDPIKTLTDGQLIDELKSRGYITKLLFNRVELKWCLSDQEKDELIDNVDWGYYTSEIEREFKRLGDEMFIEGEVTKLTNALFDRKEN
jgi:hypothetical protein